MGKISFSECRQEVGGQGEQHGISDQQTETNVAFEIGGHVDKKKPQSTWLAIKMALPVVESFVMPMKCDMTGQGNGVLLWNFYQI